MVVVLRLAGERVSATLGVRWAMSDVSRLGVGRSGCDDRNMSCLRGRSAAAGRCGQSVQRWAARRADEGVGVSCFEEREWRRARSATLLSQALGRGVALGTGASGGWVGGRAASEAAVRG